MKQKVNDELKQHFRPGVPQPHRRHDRLPPAAARTQILQIVDLMIARIETQLRNKDMGLELTDNAKKCLAKKGYDPVLGARPLRRTIQREIEDTLSERILFNELRPGQIVVVDCEGDPDEHREVQAGVPRRGEAGRGARRGAGRPRWRRGRQQRRRRRGCQLDADKSHDEAGGRSSSGRPLSRPPYRAASLARTSSAPGCPRSSWMSSDSRQAPRAASGRPSTRY